MRILDLAIKDLVQIFRDRQSAIFLVIMPIAFTLFMGFAFRPPAEDETGLPVAWVDQDNSVLSESLFELLSASESLQAQAVEAGDTGAATQQVRTGELVAVIEVPMGWGANALAGEPLPVTIITDELSTAGQGATNLARASVTRALSSATMARLFAERGADGDEALHQAMLAWREPPLDVRIEQAQQAEREERRPTGFNQSSPGMIVQFTLFGLITSASVLVLERKTRTLERLLTTAMRRSHIIAGHLLAMFLLVLGQQALLVAVGQLAFGVDYLQAPIAVLVVMVTLALWVAALGLFIGVVARGEEQVILFSLLAMFLFSALGGAWFPLEVTGDIFAAIGRLLPSAWAIIGFQNIVVRGLGMASVLQPAAILSGWALFFFFLAVWRFQRVA
jgi:ABC-2 type transport system permease protein